MSNTVIFLALTWLVACSSEPQVSSCRDSLSGVWLGNELSPGGERLRFHVLDHGKHVEIYPMFDDSYGPDGQKTGSDAVYTPAVLHLDRIGQTLVGKRTYHAMYRDKVCAFSHEAAIRACRDDNLQLAWVPTAHIDWSQCQAVQASQWTTVVLERQH